MSLLFGNPVGFEPGVTFFVEFSCWYSLYANPHESSIFSREKKKSGPQKQSKTVREKNPEGIQGLGENIKF